MKDLSKIIKERIEEFRSEVKPEEVGLVVESADGITRIKGLPGAMASEMVEFQRGIKGMVFNLERDEVVAVILGRHTDVKEGDRATLTGRVMEVPVGDELLGRIVNPMGEPQDGLGEIKTKKFRPIEFKAPEVIQREPVNIPLQTGYKLIDALIPIGRGQRELIIGDRATGKSVLALDTIINQKDKDVLCVYVAIGQKATNVLQIAKELKDAGAMAKTIIVSAPASEPASLQYLAPFAGCAMAEEFMYGQHKDVLIVYDDFSKHAQSYRTLSLLLRRPPGREAYPGDVFYLHSRLLERAAKLSPALGGGSITALPIIETQLQDVTAYIPTNVISITDGQIFLEPDLFNAGFRPAVNTEISVSRVGGKAQTKSMRRVAGRLRLDLAQYREKQSFGLFSSEIDKETHAQLVRGAVITEVLKQKKGSPMAAMDQVMIIFAAVNGYMDEYPLNRAAEFETKFLKFARTELADLSELTDKTEPRLIAAIKKFKETFV
jgi:F-type H+-transporting ATPase subunit alpha